MPQIIKTKQEKEKHREHDHFTLGRAGWDPKRGRLMNIKNKKSKSKSKKK